jgi:hypothetical protein
MINTITRILSSFAIALAVFAAHAADDDERFILDQNGCRVINPAPRAEETVTWTGKCRDGYVDGKGVLQWFQSGIADEKYEGEMSRGFAEGTGNQTQTDGGRYEGEWKASRQEGEGTYFAPDGSVYKGGWKSGKPHGFGSYRTPEGRVMRGQWVDGEFQRANEDDPNKT